VQLPTVSFHHLSPSLTGDATSRPAAGHEADEAGGRPSRAEPSRASGERLQTTQTRHGHGQEVGRTVRHTSTVGRACIYIYIYIYMYLYVFLFPCPFCFLFLYFLSFRLIVLLFSLSHQSAHHSTVSLSLSFYHFGNSAFEMHAQAYVSRNVIVITYTHNTYMRACIRAELRRKCVPACVS